MVAERSLRWFLGLLAMLAPVAATRGRGASGGAAIPRAEAQVVFRHYL